jgi:thiol-disulfide isomerase/thioredoxin
MKKILLIASTALILASCGAPAKSYNNLTACLQKNQVVMFGASWCPHCASQKKLFLKSVKDLPYFECAVGSGQAQECKDRNISSYPTWQFPDASIRALPKEAITSLLNAEVSKVRGTNDIYMKAVKENKPELLPFVESVKAKTDALMASNISEYEKLVKLTVITDGENETLTERPAYVSGRVAGERSLAEIALFGGCSDAYKMDIVGTAETGV